MTIKQLNIRLDDLVDAHVWSRHHDKVSINVYQRICISQERAAIMQLLEEVSFVNRISSYEVDISRLKYRLPIHLEERVVQIKNIIKNTNWQKPKHEVEPY